MSLEIQTNPYARGIAGGAAAKFMLVDIDRSGAFPNRKVISEHKTRAAAEKAMAKRCRRCGASLFPNRQPACHECGWD